MTSKTKIVIFIAAFLFIGFIVQILFFQKRYWYEALANESRVPVGSYILAADVSAGSGHLKEAMVNIWLQHQEENNQTAIEISIPCEKVSLIVDGTIVKPNNPSSCRSGAGETGPSAYLGFSLPVAEPKEISLELPPIVIRTQNGETTISPPISIAYYEKSKRISATFH